MDRVAALQIDRIKRFVLLKQHRVKKWKGKSELTSF